MFIGGMTLIAETLGLKPPTRQSRGQYSKQRKKSEQRKTSESKEASKRRGKRSGSGRVEKSSEESILILE